MALTRGMLKGMGLTDEQVSAIIDEHVATIDGLKADRDKFKEEAEKLPAVQKELEDLKTSIEANDGDQWQEKYNKEHENFEQYKSQVAEERREAECRNLYRSLLLECGVGESHVDAILKVTDFKPMKVGKDGKLDDLSRLSDSIKSEWAGFITSTSTQGAGVENPPTGGERMTKEAFGQLSLADQMKYANEHPEEMNSLL